MKKRRKLLVHFYEDYYFGECGDPWQEVYELKIYDNGFIEFINFVDDRIPSRIIKTLKTDYSNSFYEDIMDILKVYKDKIQEFYSSEIFYEKHSKGFIFISGIKKIEHSFLADKNNSELKEILNMFFCS